jgi:hypothetical protein
MDKSGRRIGASAAWLIGCWIGDGFYVHAHGFDVFALVVWILALLPAWPIIADDVELKFLGHLFRVKSVREADVRKAAAEVIEAKPEALKLASKASANGLPRVNERGMPAAHRWRLGQEPHLARSATEQFHVSDPNLLLVNLRIEIERRLKRIAELVDIRPRQSPAGLVQELRRAEILPADLAVGLLRFVDYGNRAAHGAFVEPNVAVELLRSQDEVLAALDEIAQALTCASRR